MKIKDLLSASVLKTKEAYQATFSDDMIRALVLKPQFSELCGTY